MTKILKRPLSVLLAVMMIAGIFAVVPISASAAAVTPKYKITINGKVVVSSTTLPYKTTATNLKNKAGYSSYTVTSLKVYKVKDNIGTISGQNFTVNKSGSEQLDIGLKKGSTTGHITPNVVCTPLTKCVCEATGYTGNYDGEPHTIEGLTVTSPESGATIKYGTVSGTYNLTEPPTFTEVGTHTVYYQISASGWVTLTGSVNVNILRSGYTVTWKNWDGTELEKDEDVAKDATPEYNGAEPTKEADTFNNYTFAGWKNGNTTYAPGATLPGVAGDTEYTAQFTAVPKLFVGNTITLNADIGVNFFINSAYANFDGAQTATVVFTWDDGNYTKEVNLKKLTKESNGCYKATCDVVAAHMAHKIHAVVYLDGTALDETDDFSVQDYAEKLFKNPKENDPKGRPKELQDLAKALLNYGSMAQTVFEDNLHEKPALANTNVGAWSTDDYAAVTAGLVSSKINGSASDLNSVATQLGAKYFTNSLIYLSKNTLRIYFTPTSYPGEIPNADAYDGNLSGYYYYVDHANIKAAELDDQQSFSVNGVNFTFSALDYVVAVIGSGSMTDTQKNLAKALFLYNQAANAYFD